MKNIINSAREYKYNSLYKRDGLTIFNKDDLFRIPYENDCTLRQMRIISSTGIIMSI